MTTLEDMEKRLMDAVQQDHAVTVSLRGLRGYKGSFSALLPEVPRPGDLLTFALKHRRGQGRYIVRSIEWIVGGYGEVIVYLEPAAEGRAV